MVDRFQLDLSTFTSIGQIFAWYGHNMSACGGCLRVMESDIWPNFA